MSMHQVVCLPGGVAPAEPRYAPLRREVAGAAELHLKDLEVYRDEVPPEGFAIELELAAIDRLADASGLAKFNLVGYSGGGFVAIAYAGTRPERLLSLAVFEPARVPGEPTGDERRFSEELQQSLAGLSGPAYMEAFVRGQVKPGAELAPPPPPSPAMARRPAGIAALSRAFDAYRFDRDLLRRCAFPVFYGYGDQSHDEQAVKAGVLAGLFADIRVRRFAGIHHFVAPERIYTAEHAAALVDLWRRGERASAG